jgi:outer membrane immunogenic protein
MKRWLLAGAMAFATAGQGLASDLPPPAAPPSPRAPAAYVPPVAAIYNWGGVYFGFNLGFGFGTSSWNDPRNFSGLTSTGNFNLTGFLTGPTIGVNFQTDSFVFGAEADFDVSGSALASNVRPRAVDSRRCVRGWATPQIASCSTAQRAVHSAIFRQA